MINKTISKSLFIIFGGILMIFISITIIYPILIPDICYYHEHPMNPILSLFYSARSGDNGHPSPNLFNFVVSFLIGGFLGYKLDTIIKKVGSK